MICQGDLLLTELICGYGLVPNLLNSPPWKKFIALLSDTFKAKGSSVFFEQYIPQEASRVRVKQKKLLCAQTVLTCTFDGNTTAGNETYYSFHGTDQDRKVYYIEAVEASDVSHTGEWVTEQAIKVCSPLFCIAEANVHVCRS
jgi:hypothetical protein